MVKFVLVGIVDCRNTAIAFGILKRLQSSLPNFEYTKFIRQKGDWGAIVTSLNREHDWHVMKCPIIYKEVLKFGGKRRILIGSLSEFCEYCNEYYNFDCWLPDNEVDAILQTMKTSMNAQSAKTGKTFDVMIYGCSHRMTTLLIMELMEMTKIAASDFSALRLYLFDKNATEYDYKQFEKFVNDFFEMYAIKATYCDHFRDEMKHVDLLLMIDDISHLKDGNDEAMGNYLSEISLLAEAINYGRNENLRIIFANEGVSSLIATILFHQVSLKPGNIVVLSSDLGVSYIAEISRRSGLKCGKFFAPPVWGWLDNNIFVDVGSAVMKCNVHKPFRRAVKATPQSTLLHGTIETQLRFIRYFTDDMIDLDEAVHTRRQIIKEKLGSTPIIAKIQALIHVLKVWYGIIPLQEPILSLGVLSNGSFGIPKGLIFSQPAILTNEGWLPFSKYPISKESLKRVQQIAIEAQNHYKQYSDNVSLY